MLLISDRSSDHTLLSAIPPGSEGMFVGAGGIATGLTRIHAMRPGVVISANKIVGGKWTAIRDAVVWCAAAREIIVTNPHADDDLLCAEAMSLGAYDLLAQPFVASKVLRITAMAMQTRIRRPLHRPHKAMRTNIAHGNCA